MRELSVSRHVTREGSPRRQRDGSSQFIYAQEEDILQLFTRVNRMFIESAITFLLMVYHRKFLHSILLTSLLTISSGWSNEDAKRLFDDLMLQSAPTTGNKPTRSCECSAKVAPVADHRRARVGSNYDNFRLAQTIVPDIVLINNAKGTFNITIDTKATLHPNGCVVWEPPAIYKSLCQFGSWTYPSGLLHLSLMDAVNETQMEVINERGELELLTVVEEGIDLDDYYPSVEWDIMSTQATKRNKHFFASKNGIYEEMDFDLALRRKPLFYTVNLVFPCVGISFLTVLVFYLPSESGEKVSLSINILVALTMFFLLLIEIIPANSTTLPFVGKYLLFTMILVTLSVLITVVSLQFHFRKPTTHQMGKTVRRLFLDLFPRLLCMRRPLFMRRRAIDRASERALLRYYDRKFTQNSPISSSAERQRQQQMEKLAKRAKSGDAGQQQLNEKLANLYNSPKALKSFENLCFIAELLRKKDRDTKQDQEWKFVAMVFDRLFLIVFSFACLFGTCWILIQAPTFYDTRQPKQPMTSL
uniref:Neur_chan_LBD domain-containing protein n=1 Tax=Globodera pallida TaxID=36090 RepID=A0A183BKR8_GLOPA